MATQQTHAQKPTGEAQDEAARDEQRLVEDTVRQVLHSINRFDTDGDHHASAGEWLSLTKAPFTVAEIQDKLTTVSIPEAYRHPTPEQAKEIGEFVAQKFQASGQASTQDAERLGSRIAFALVNGSVREEQDKLPTTAEIPTSFIGELSALPFSIGATEKSGQTR